MFREMRRSRQSLPEEEIIQIFNRGTSGVLSCSGDNDYPYAVPVSFVYHDRALYFHTALTGHKVDALRRNSKVSFCVIDQDIVVPEEVTTYYRSAIAFGTARILDTEPEKMTAARLLTDKFASDCPEAVEEDIRKNYDRMYMVEIKIDHMTGKESLKLTKQRADGNH